MAFFVLPAFAEVARSADADFFGETDSRRTAERYLTERGIAFERRPLFQDRGGFGVSIHVDLPSSTAEPASGTLVIAAPLYSTQTPSGTESSFGVRAALAFAARVAADGAPMDVRVALLADEYSQLPQDVRGETLLGLRDLADRYGESERTALVYLDLREPKAGLSIVHGSSGTVAPLGVLNPLLSAFGGMGIPLSVAVPFNELYRMNLIQGSDALVFLHGRDFPALLVNDSRRAAPGGVPTPESFADGLYDYARVLRSIPEAADRRYFLFSLGTRVIALPEGLSVALFALTAALGMATVLIYSLTHRHLLIVRGMVFLRRSWTLPFFLIVLFVCILFADFSLSAILRLHGASKATPRYGEAALKFVLALSLYTVVSPILKLRPIPKRAHFYGTAACILLAAASFLAAMIDFTFVPIFLWAFVLALASTTLHEPAAGFILAGLAPLQIFAAAAAAAGSGETGPARALLSNDLKLNLFFAFTLLPFLMLFRRAAALARSRAGRSQEKRAFYSRLLFFAGILLAIFSYAGDTARAERQTKRPVRERIESTSVSQSPLELKVSASTFLDRRTLKITVSSDKPLVRLDLALEGDDNLSVYDSPVPYTLSEDGKRAMLALGERPMNPLNLELTLPLSAKGQIRASGVYTSPLERGSAAGEGKDFVLVVDAVTDIGGDI